jgi:hypothetical protein
VSNCVVTIVGESQQVGVMKLESGDYAILTHATDKGFVNTVAWSPDGRIMYHSDSTSGIIEAWDFDAHTGGLANHRVLATLSNEEGRPDGAAMDVEGRKARRQDALAAGFFLPGKRGGRSNRKDSGVQVLLDIEGDRPDDK